MTLLPYAFEMNLENRIHELCKKEISRQKLGLPIDKKILLSVGAVNSNHKRMDYVVEEFSFLNQEEYFLVILGQISNDSDEIIGNAANLLKVGNYKIKQVDKNDVAEYMLACDYFILASLHEGLPRVLPEALFAGLLPIVHDYSVTRETLADYAVYKDLTKPKQLAYAIEEIDTKKIDRLLLASYSHQKYSWDKLSVRYSFMIQQMIK